MGKSENRLKLFLENIFAYGTVTVLGKLVPIIMLPIITAMLVDTADYGRFDMFNTIVEFGGNFALLGLYDAMFREFFERDDSVFKRKVSSTAMNIVLFTAVVVGLSLIVFSQTFAQLFLGDAGSNYLVILAGMGAFVYAVRTIVAAPTRMRNQRRVYLISNVGGSVLYYLLAILLVWLGFNYAGMIWANLAYMTLLMIFFSVLNRRDFGVKQFDRGIAKNLIKTGLPLMPTFLAYWVFNSINKVFITNMMGLAALGVFSVGARVGQVSQIIYSAFSGGWQYFAFSTMKDTDQVALNSKVLEYLGAISYVCFMLATLVDNFIFKLLFTGDYVRGVEVFPYLFLSPLLLMLFQVAANQSLVYRKSYYCTLSLVAGVGINLLLNYTLIPVIGIKGAALATLSGYMISVVVILILMVRKKWMTVSRRFLIASLTTILFTVMLTTYDHLLCKLFAGFGTTFILFLYRGDLKQLGGMVFDLLRKKRVQT